MSHQVSNRTIALIRQQVSYPIPSPKLLPLVTQGFHKAVEQK